MLKHMPSGNHTPCSLLSHSYVCGFYLQNQNGNITGKGVGKMQFLGFQLLQLKGELRRVRLILNINRLYLAHYQSSSPTPQRFYPSTNSSCSHCEFPLSYLTHSHLSRHLQAAEASSTDFFSNLTLVQLHWNFSSDFPIRATNSARLRMKSLLLLLNLLFFQILFP